MGLKDKIAEFIAPSEEEEELELTASEAEALSKYEKPQNEGASRIAASTNIVLFEPRSFDDADEIGHHIKNKRACVINLHRMQPEYRQRLIDFLSGIMYGVDGTMKKIDDNVFICSPKNLQIGGDINLSSSNDR